MLQIERLYREIIGPPTQAEIADMLDYNSLPERILRAAFERTDKLAGRPSWAYARTILDQGPTLEAMPLPSRKSVLCDHCRKPYDPDWLTLEGWYAFCKRCIDWARAMHVPGPETQHRCTRQPCALCELMAPILRVEIGYTESAAIVRRHFGMVAAG